MQALARCRPTAHTEPTTIAVLTACKALAQRIEFLQRQTDDLTAELDTLVTRLNPALRAAYGVGADSAAQLLITAVTNTHRLAAKPPSHGSAASRPSRPPGQNHPPSTLARRGPRRQQRPAPHRLGPLVPRPAHPRLRHPPAGRGHSKGHPASAQTRHRPRDVHHLTKPCPIDDYRDLRPTRQARNITLTNAATHFGVWPNDISRLERGLKRDDTLAANYRQWLNTQLINAA